MRLCDNSAPPHVVGPILSVNGCESGTCFYEPASKKTYCSEGRTPNYAKTLAATIRERDPELRNKIVTYPDCNDSDAKIGKEKDLSNTTSFFKIEISSVALDPEGIAALQEFKVDVPAGLMFPGARLEVKLRAAPGRTACQVDHEDVALGFKIGSTYYPLSHEAIVLGAKEEKTVLIEVPSKGDNRIELTEKIIKAVHDGVPIWLTASPASPSRVYMELKTQTLLPLTNCLPIAGRGDHSVVMMRTADHKKQFTSDSLSNLLEITTRFYFTELGNINPYKTYIDKFSVLIDLYPHENTTWDPLAKNETWYNLLFDAKHLYWPRERSSCRGQEGYIVNGVSLFDDAIGIAFSGSKTALIDTYKGNLSTFTPSALEEGRHVLLHEYTHLLSDLSDEYSKGTLTSSIRDVPEEYVEEYSTMNGKNCSSNPIVDYLNPEDQSIYGALNIRSCGFEEKYRPSKDSLMNSARSGVNVVSCGHIVKSILNSVKDPRTFFPLCDQMEGIVP
jgi:hypothetical protein